MLSVRSLLAEFDLDLAVEGANDASPIRWVHISELEDPTPFLSGGELLLTTGINLKTAGRQRKFVRRLAESKAAGLGLAVGLDHAELPAGADRGGRGATACRSSSCRSSCRSSRSPSGRRPG